jgi:predicted nucleotidyltransferase
MYSPHAEYDSIWSQHLLKQKRIDILRARILIEEAQAAMRKSEAIEITKAYAARVHSDLDPNADIYLFGSAARDEMDERSDIDIAVLSSSFTEDVINNRVTLSLLSNMVNPIIEPHPILLEDWRTGTPFVLEIKREGIQI